MDFITGWRQGSERQRPLQVLEPSWLTNRTLRPLTEIQPRSNMFISDANEFLLCWAYWIWEVSGISSRDNRVQTERWKIRLEIWNKSYTQEKLEFLRTKEFGKEEKVREYIPLGSKSGMKRKEIKKKEKSEAVRAQKENKRMPKQTLPSREGE